MAYLSIVLSLVALLSGTLSWEARTALPGDPLYTYKLVVNEQVESLFTHGDIAQAQLNLALLRKRLDEAQTLARTNRLDAAAQTTVTTNVTQHVQSVTDTLDRLQTSGSYADAATLATNLFYTLDSERAQMVDLSSQSPASVQLSLAPVLVTVRTTLATVALLSTKAQARAAGLAPLAIKTNKALTANTDTQL